MAGNDRERTPDPFTQFWGEMVSRMSGVGLPAAPPADPGPAMKQMQRVFLEALAKYCDEFMRSPQFLEAMKQNMENAMTFRRQVDQFLTQALHGAQAPARGDVEELVALVRNVEERVLARVEELNRKLEAATASLRPPGGKAPGARRAVSRPGARRKPVAGGRSKRK